MNLVGVVTMSESLKIIDGQNNNRMQLSTFVLHFVFENLHSNGTKPLIIFGFVISEAMHNSKLKFVCLIC